MKIAAVLSGDGLYSCGFSSANVFVALFLSQILDHHLHIVFFLLLLLFLFFFFADRNTDGNKKRITKTAPGKVHDDRQCCFTNKETQFRRTLR